MSVEMLYAQAKARELYETARAVNPLPAQPKTRRAKKRAPIARAADSVRDAVDARLAWNGFSPSA